MEETYQKEKGGSSLLSWIRYIVVAVLVALFINNFLVVNATVITGSMESTVMTGSRVFCNRLAYISEDPQRFDIVIFNFDQYGEKTRFFKRIIGLPGEKVEIRDGKVFIDESETPLEDSFVNEEPYGDFGPFYVPEGSYFMLGDNRNNSDDSKYWPNPYLPREDILGKAFLIYYPEFRTIKDVGA